MGPKTKSKRGRGGVGGQNRRARVRKKNLMTILETFRITTTSFFSLKLQYLHFRERFNRPNALIFQNKIFWLQNKIEGQELITNGFKDVQRNNNELLQSKVSCHLYSKTANCQITEEHIFIVHL